MFKKTSHTTHGGSAPPPGDDADKPEPIRQNRVREHKRSILSPSMTVSGDISGEEDLMLDGKMEGSINLPKNEVIIGPEGQVTADLTALKVSVEGRLTGDIKSGERVVIKHSGRVEGNIVSPRVVLEDGCQYKGTVEMNIDSESKASTSTKPQEPMPRDPKPTAGAGAPKNDQYGSHGKSRASGAS